jgi:hypothetical protein
MFLNCYAVIATSKILMDSTADNHDKVLTVVNRYLSDDRFASR